jgi:5-methylcytosine-specific restriction enzyme A
MATSTDKRFYNSAGWQQVRKQQLQIEPLCEACCPHRLVPATHVDHIRPMAKGGDALSLGNLQSLCAPCHSAKTSRDGSIRRAPSTRAYIKRGCNADGSPIDPKHDWNAEKSLRADPPRPASSKILS